MDLGLWGLSAGTGWASGVTLYLVAGLLGGAGRLGLMEVPDLVTRTDVLVAAVVMFVVEFVAIAAAAPMLAILVVALLLITGTAMAFGLASLARRGRQRWRERREARRRRTHGAHHPADRG